VQPDPPGLVAFNRRTAINDKLPPAEVDTIGAGSSMNIA